MYGHSLASKNILRLVLEHHRKRSGLREEDVDVQDLQNFPAVQRLAMPRVRECLEDLQKHEIDGVVTVRDVSGTILHLYIMWCYLEIFYGIASLLGRVKLASFVAHMLYYGYSYNMVHGHGHTVQGNWLTRETMTDVLMSVMFAVNLIRLFRDKFSHLPVPLHRCGSDCCEEFFSQLGQQTRNKHNATTGEALERASQILRKQVIKAVEAKSLVFAPPKRSENLWCKLNGYPSDSDSVSALLEALSDYGSVHENGMLGAWDAGMALARETAEEVGMKDDLVRTGNWDEPWKLFEKSVQGRCNGEADDCRDGGEEEAMADAQGDDTDASATTQRDVGLVRAAMLEGAQEMDEHVGEGDGEDADDEGTKHGVSPLVKVPGIGMVYKMRLVVECCLCPDKLPLDRLQRVRHRSNDGRGAPTPIEDPASIGLYDNVAVAIDDGNGLYKWYVAQVQAMTKFIEQGRRVDYCRPVPLVGADGSVKLTLKYYKAVDESNTGLLQFGGFEGEETDMIPLTSVICRVCSLKYTDAGLFQLSDEERDVLDMFVNANNDRVGHSRRQREAARAKEAANADTGPAGVAVTTRTGRTTKRYKTFLP